MNTLGIGNLIKGVAKRDAIHVAIVPMVAAHSLSPGDKVGVEYGNASTTASRFIGVVDPFLGESVKRGQKAWVFLFPGEAKNLRHEWDHPDLPATQSEPEPEDTYDECRGCD